MDDEDRIATRRAFPSVSAYLLRPLRSHEQAVADIAAAKKALDTVTAFVPLSVVEKKRRAHEPDIAA